jgi:hypothetical protein
MKEKRKGPIGRAAGLAGGVAATVRRMQREREPRLLVYDETGYARLVQPNGRGYERLLETAERMVALVDQAEAEANAKPRRARRTDGAEATKPLGTRDADAKPRGAGRTKAAAEGKARGAGRAGATKPRRAPRTKDAGDAKPRRAPRTKGTDDAKPRRAQRNKGAEDAKPRRAGSAGSADEPTQPRRARRSTREGDA